MKSLLSCEMNLLEAYKIWGIDMFGSGCSFIYGRYGFALKHLTN
jgi:hypothetical protein